MHYFQPMTAFADICKICHKIKAAENHYRGPDGELLLHDGKIEQTVPQMANERQVGGTHYRSPLQHWDYVWANNLDYFQGQITKYVTRWRNKNGLADLEKARHFLDKYIELVSREPTAGCEPEPHGYVDQDRQGKGFPGNPLYPPSV